MDSAFLDEGRRRLEEKDWVGAIQSLSWAKDADPSDPRAWLALIETYEAAAAAESEPDLLQQAWNVCRDLRDRRLAMNAADQTAFRDAFIRVRDKLVAARAGGWTPPLPRSEVWKE
ncbi:MAG TPA: hypothetical protein VMQ62_06060 [Dongiaceae bacterium]|nr:hypothetical protein [Dongiaceae bacterium]